MSNKFASIINSTLYTILFIADDRWIRWTKAWQSSCVVTHHTCMGSSLLQMVLYHVHYCALGSSHIQIAPPESEVSSLWTLWLLKQIKKLQKIIDKNIAKRYPFLILNGQSCHMATIYFKNFKQERKLYYLNSSYTWVNKQLDTSE